MSQAVPLRLAWGIPRGAQFAEKRGDVMDLFQRNSTLLDDRLEIEVAGLGEKNALHTSITYPLDAFGCLVGFYRHPRQQSCPCVGPDGRVLTFLDFGGAELGRELRVSRAWLED